MRSRWGAALLCACAVSLLCAATAGARSKPSWYTGSFHQQVVKAGAAGVAGRRGGDQHRVPRRPGGRREGAGLRGRAGRLHRELHLHRRRLALRRHARHRTDQVGQPVAMQVDTTTVAVVGTVSP